MPRVSLPDIDPDPSNTIIASSRQGGIVFSSAARDVEVRARSMPRGHGKTPDDASFGKLNVQETANPCSISPIGLAEP